MRCPMTSRRWPSRCSATVWWWERTRTAGSWRAGGSPTRSRRCRPCEADVRDDRPSYAAREQERGGVGWGEGASFGGAAASIVAGGALTLAALIFGTAPLLVPGLGFMVLGALAAVWTVLAAVGARVSRSLSAERIEEGEPIEALITVRRGLLGPARAEVLDPLAGNPISLAAPPSLMRGERESRIRLQVCFEQRGRRRLEPPVLRVSGPLGLGALARRGRGAAEELLVLPRTEPVRWASDARVSHPPRSTSTVFAPTGSVPPARASTGPPSPAALACSSATSAPMPKAGRW